MIPPKTYYPSCTPAQAEEAARRILELALGEKLPKHANWLGVHLRDSIPDSRYPDWLSHRVVSKCLMPTEIHESYVRCNGTDADFYAVVRIGDLLYFYPEGSSAYRQLEHLS